MAKPKVTGTYGPYQDAGVIPTRWTVEYDAGTYFTEDWSDAVSFARTVHVKHRGERLRQKTLEYGRVGWPLEYVTACRRKAHPTESRD